jgi:hypothetical protein
MLPRHHIAWGLSTENRHANTRLRVVCVRGASVGPRMCHTRICACAWCMGGEGEGRWAMEKRGVRSAVTCTACSVAATLWTHTT